MTADVRVCLAAYLLQVLSWSLPLENSCTAIWGYSQQCHVPWVAEKELNTGKMEIEQKHLSRRSQSCIPESSSPTPRLPLVSSLSLAFRLQ